MLLPYLFAKRAAMGAKTIEFATVPLAWLRKGIRINNDPAAVRNRQAQTAREGASTHESASHCPTCRVLSERLSLIPPRTLFEATDRTNTVKESPVPFRLPINPCSFGSWVSTPACPTPRLSFVLALPSAKRRRALANICPSVILIGFQNPHSFDERHCYRPWPWSQLGFDYYYLLNPLCIICYIPILCFGERPRAHPTPAWSDQLREGGELGRRPKIAND